MIEKAQTRIGFGADNGAEILDVTASEELLANRPPPQAVIFAQVVL